jgi:hypothetical protein
MTQDLLQLRDLEPPMGDLFTHATFAVGRSIWTQPLAGESDLPASRIIHARVLRLPGRARLRRLGLRQGQGYHKCGSRQDPDWITAVRLLALRDGQWQEALRRERLAKPAPGAVRWFNLGGLEVAGVLIGIRRSGIDAGWTPWNLDRMSGPRAGGRADRSRAAAVRTPVEGRAGAAWPVLPRGVTATQLDGEVRYRTRDFEVGFHLNRARIFLSWPARRGSRARRGQYSLIKPAVSLQGPRLHEAGRPPALAPAVRCDLEGRTTVRGSTVTDDFKAGDARTGCCWRVTPRGLTLRMRRTAARTLLAWHSAAWAIGWRNSVSPSSALGRSLPDGETGALALPALLASAALSRHLGGRRGARAPVFAAERLLPRPGCATRSSSKLGEQRTAARLDRLQTRG